MVIFEALHKDYGRFGPSGWKYTRYSVMDNGTVVCDSEEGTSLLNRIFRREDRNKVYDAADAAADKTEKTLSEGDFAKLREMLVKFGYSDVTAVRGGSEEWIMTSFDGDGKRVHRTEGSIEGVELLENIMSIIK